MKYTSNVLPARPSAYTLTNASIVDGTLSLSANGSAHYAFTKDVLSKLTEHFRLSLYATTQFDNYSPSVFVYITAQTADSFYNYTCTPTGSDIYSADLTLEASDYTYFAITITSTVPVTFPLWELCPEAADDNTTTIIEGVEQSLPKLLDDHNMYPFTIGQAEDTIALITCNLLNDTDLQGSFLLVYNALQDCVLTIRFKDNGATELFCPLIYDLKAGRGNIGVPHAYLNRLAGLHNVTVTAQVSTGTIAVATRGMLFTIDGGYLAKRVIDFGTDIRDISVKQLPSDNAPSEIWAIGIESNEAVVRRRSYNDNTTSSYEPVFSAGEAVEAAIEFNGNWALRQGNTVYTLETDELPYVFIVDTLGNLYVQYGGDEASRLLLDTGVSKISACRGYKSHTRQEEDQGLVVAYIKDSTVFYRAYRYDSTIAAYFWDYAKELQELGSAEFVNIHRLNDYRMGIASSTQAGNMWAISDRTYVSQASKPEYFDFNVSDTAAVCSLIPSNDTSVLTYKAIVDDDTHYRIEFNFPIRSVEEDLLSIISVSGGATNSDIQHVEIVGSLIIISLARQPDANVNVSFKPFSLMRKGAIFGWWFIQQVAVTFILPTFKAENFTLTVNAHTTCNLYAISGVDVLPDAEIFNINVIAQPTINFYAVTNRYTETTETFNLNTVCSASCTLTHISVIPT